MTNDNTNNDINVEDLMRRILEEEEYVKSQALCYDEYLPEFILRAEEDLEIIEAGAIELENNHDDMDAINSMFRSFHNIKGSSGFVAQINIQNIAHQTETLMDLCRKGLKKADKSLIDLILKSADLIKQICDNVQLNVDEGFLEVVYFHIDELQKADNTKTDDINIEISNEQNTPCINSNQLDFYNEFQEESKEYFNNIEKNLEILTKDNNNKKILNAIYKDFHSIKGMSGFLGQKIPHRITYEAEKFINKAGKNVDDNFIKILHSSVELLKEFFNDTTSVQNKEFLEKICSNIQEINQHIKSIELSVLNNSSDDAFLKDFILETTEHLQDIEVKIIDLEKQKYSEDVINSILRAFHAIKGLSGFASQQMVEKIAHQSESLLQSIKHKKTEINETSTNLILKSVDLIKNICNEPSIISNADFKNQINVLLTSIEECENETESKILCELTQDEPQKIGEILVEQNKITTEQVDELLEKQKTEFVNEKFGEIAVKENLVASKDVVSAIKIQQQQKQQTESYMRIATGKVDSLVEMVGELVINQSLIEQYAISVLNADNTFITNFNRMARITRDLQNLAMFLRLVPLKSTFQKITRVARDTINELNKDIDFSTYGDETEIDRIVTEKLLDPLVHLVKNAISHGIESSEDRLRAGKSTKGNVSLHAYNKRGNIYIEILDDGGGINTERVYQKALEKGLIEPNKDYSEKEIQEFIMLPGFSTVEIANNISGRGVGMDVVKTEIQKIGGKVEIESKKGKGTKFTLKIPLNHAIMNGLIVDIEGTKYILPTVNVKQIVQPKEENWIYTLGKCTQIKVREDIIPLVDIKEFFGKQANEAPILVVIIEMDQKHIALPVRNVLNRQEVVIKPVSEEFSALDYVSGMSILGDGKVSLILDIESMFVKLI